MILACVTFNYWTGNRRGRVSDTGFLADILYLNLLLHFVMIDRIVL